MKKMTLAWMTLVMMLSACTAIPPKQTIPATTTEEQVAAFIADQARFDQVITRIERHQGQWFGMGYENQTQTLQINVEFHPDRVPNPKQLAKMERGLSQIAGLPVTILPVRVIL